MDGADYAAQLLRSHGIAESDVDTLWTAIALHTTSGVPQHMKPDIGRVCAGVEMDVPGFAPDPFPDAQRDAVVTASPPWRQFKQDIPQAFQNGSKARRPPPSTSGPTCWR